MNILLTGGAGYIGSHVVLALLDNGHSVSVIDDLSTGHKDLLPDNIQFLECNINNKNKVASLIKQNNFDVLMHFAAFIKVEESIKNPEKYFTNNTDNAINLFNTCFENNLKNIIFSSTAAAYGNPETNINIPETELLRPLNPYGESKIKTEKFLLQNKDRFKFIILRYFNVAGADPNLRTGLISKNTTHLIKITSEVAVGKKEKVTIFCNDYNTPDGTAIRDYIHVSDLADIHLKAMEYLISNKKSKIFNCGYGKGYSVKEVVDITNKITGGSIKFEYGKRRLGDAENLVSDISKFHQYIDWTPRYNNLSTIIETAINWEKKLNAKDL